LPANKDANGLVIAETTSDSLTSVCIKKALFALPVLKDKCAIVKINKVPTGFVKAYPVIT